MLPPPHLHFWAKLGKVVYQESYHPLLFHLVDVAVVARRLWYEVLRPPLQKRFASTVGLSVADCEPWVSFWVGAHDSGKASPGFQHRDNATVLVNHLRGAGYDFDTTKPEPHGTVGVPALTNWMEARGVPKECAQRV